MASDPRDRGKWNLGVRIEDGPDRLRRPKAQSRATFDSLLEEWGGVLNDSLVPIEAVRPGDQQVVAASHPKRLNFPVVALDSLAALPEVTSVVASTIVEAHRPLPSVRELFLLHDTIVPAPPTLRNLPRLESLFALIAPSDRKLVVEALPDDTLRRLAVNRFCLDRVDPLGRLTNLEELILNNCYPGDSLHEFGKLSKLRRLRIYVYQGTLKGWKSLRDCKHLEEAHLSGLKAADLRGLKGWTRLRRLAISQPGLRSLVGIEALTALEELHLLGVTIDDLAPLRGHGRLRRLSLHGTRSIHDLGAVAALPALENLEIAQAGIEDRGILHIASLRPLAQCATLKELSLHGTVVEDSDLSALIGLPELRRAEFSFDDGSLANAAASLRRARPDIEVVYHTLSPTPGRKVGDVVIHSPGEGIDSWWIRDDLVDVLRVPTNHAAEGKVRKELAAHDPALAKRLSFDSEADAVVVHAKNEADIRAVAELIGRLSGTRRTGNV